MPTFDNTDWKRLFRTEGERAFINSVVVEAYRDLDFIAVQLNDVFTGYLSHDDLQRCNQRGVKIYKDTDTVNELFQSIQSVENKIQTVHSKSITESTTEAFINLLIKFVQRYRRTEFFYSDLAYERRNDNAELHHNLERFGSLKYEARQRLDNIFFGKDCYVQQYLQRIAAQTEIKTETLLQYTYNELIEVSNGEKVPSKVIKNRGEACVLYYDDGITIKTGDAAMPIINAVQRNEARDVIEGTVAYEGVAIGPAKIISQDYDSFHNISDEVKQVQQGDVLITETTSPKLMPAIQRVSAIVADQGGLMSHAAVVSRELEIPCIVGTEYATTVFENGNQVRVDAVEGIIEPMS